jgi:hypothetical protein
MRGVKTAVPTAFAPRPRLGELLLVLAGWVGATVVLSSLLAPAAYALVEALAPGRFPFQRVLRRIALLVAVVLLVALRRRIGVRSWNDLGLGGFRARRGETAWGVVAGAATIAVLLLAELAAGTRIAGWNLAWGEVVEALAGAAVIGVLEEGLCRGALLFPFGRLTGARFWIANAATSAIYATAHFARGGGRPREVDWASGWRVWGEIGPAVGNHFEAWVGLFATGALFYALAWRQGHAWGAAGLHAGAVLALQIGGELTDPARGNRSLFLVDGLLPGYWIAALAMAAAVWLWRRGERAAG